MKTTRSDARQVPILAISLLVLALLGCKAIAQIMPASQPAPATSVSMVVTTEVAELPATPSPTPAVAQQMPTPTTAAPPAASATGVPTLLPGNWQPLPDLPRQINTLVVDPGNSLTLYAGTGSTGAGSGVYKSEDAGLTWRLVSTGLPSEDVKALAFSRDDPPILYAAVGNNVFVTADGGANWSQQAQDVSEYGGFEQIRVAPGNGKVLYGVAVIEGVFRSDDGGQNWLAVNEGLPKDSNGSLNVQSLAIDPTDTNVIYLGTGWSGSNGNGVFKSTDGGTTWMAANRGMIDYSITALAVDPLNPQTVYAGGFGGELFKSTDGGATWNELAVNLPDQANVLGIVIDPAVTETVYVLYDRVGVLVSHDGGMQWNLLGKPGEFDYPTFTAMAVTFDPQPVLVIGIGGEGGWRYATAPAGEGPASPVSSSLKLGHWANENGTHGEANVSFDLSDAGNISNFSMTASFGTPTQGCTMEIDRLQMQVNEDGTFVISYSMEYADVETELGPAVMSLGIIPEGQPYEVLHISGNTTDTTMNGTYKVTVCSHTLYFDDNTGPWKAQWKNP